MKKIYGYKDYFINKQGEIFSQAQIGRITSNKKVNLKRRRPKRWYKLHSWVCKRDRSSYIMYDLMLNGKRRHRYLHHLLLETFVKPKPKKNSVVRHLNGNSLDNRLINICWGTIKENYQDRIRLKEYPYNRNQNR